MPQIFHLPYFHLRTWSSERFPPVPEGQTDARYKYEHLVGYQEYNSGAIVIRKDTNFVYILVNPRPEYMTLFALDESYISEASQFTLDDTYFDPTYGSIGKVALWRVETETKPGGSGSTYTLQKPAKAPGEIVASSGASYDIIDSQNITDPQKLIKVTEKFVPYVLLDSREFVIDTLVISCTSNEVRLNSGFTPVINGNLFNTYYKGLNPTILHVNNKPVYLGKFLVESDYGDLWVNTDGTFKFEFKNKLKITGKNYPAVIEYPYSISYQATFTGTNPDTGQPVTGTRTQTLDFTGNLTVVGSIQQTGQSDPVAKDIYGIEAATTGVALQFPAGRLFGETANNIVPPAYINIPGYGASSDSKPDVILNPPYSVEIETKNPDIEMLLRKIDYSRFTPYYRNGSLILDKTYMFEMMPNVNIDKGLMFKFNFYLPINNEPSKPENILVTQINGKVLKVVLQPLHNDYSLAATAEILQEYFIYVTYNSQSIIYKTPIPTNNWYMIDVAFNATGIELYVGNVKLTNKVATTEELGDIEKLTNKITLLEGLQCLLKSIQVYTYSYEIEEPLDHFVDYRMIDFYQLRTCAEDCPGALRQGSEELQKDLFVPKQKLNLRDEQTEACPFILFDYDPYYVDPATGKQTGLQNAIQCSGTTLVPIDVNYPPAFTEEIIQAPHYKINVNLNFEPFRDDSIISQNQCRMLYEIFEKGRPVSRVSHYTLGLTFTTDFSGRSHGLYKKSYTANWSTTSTITREVLDDSEIFTAGEAGFDNKMEEGEIKHKINSTELIAQSFNLQDRLRYPAQQYAVNESLYIISFAPNKESGYALIQRAKNVTLVEYFTSKPLYIATASNVESAVVLQLQNAAMYREEIKEFNAIGQSIRADLLESFDDGKILIQEQDIMFYVATPQKVGNIKHNLGIMGCLVQVYNEKGQAMKPSEVVLIDENNLQVQFDNPTKGTIGLRRVGNPNGKGQAVNEIFPHDVIDDDGNSYTTRGYLLLGDLNGSNIINFEYASHFSVYSNTEDKKMQSKNLIKVPLADYQETQTDYTFIFRLPAYGGEDLSIKEIGLFNAKDEMCFYSIGYLLYIVRDFELEITYKISKADL